MTGEKILEAYGEKRTYPCNRPNNVCYTTHAIGQMSSADKLSVEQLGFTYEIFLDGDLWIKYR